MPIHMLCISAVFNIWFIQSNHRDRDKLRILYNRQILYCVHYVNTYYITKKFHNVTCILGRMYTVIMYGNVKYAYRKYYIYIYI